MSGHASSARLGFRLNLLVIFACLLILGLGWGLGVDLLMRPTGTGNAIVPGTAFCLMLVAVASMPLPRAMKSMQRVVLLLCLLVLAGITVVSLVTGRDGGAWVISRTFPQDGMSIATRIGLIGAMLQPAVRLGLLPLSRDWQFHLPFFGLVISLLMVLLILIDPGLSNLMPMMKHLSLHTALLLCLLYSAQAFQGGHLDDLPGMDDLGGLSA